MKMKSVLFGAILGVFAGHAHSADIYSEPVQTQAFEPEYSFSGPYIGLGAGYGMRNHDTSYKESCEDKEAVRFIGGCDISLGLDGFGADGFFGEIFLGYQRQFGNWVLGVEGMVMYDDIQTTANIGPLKLEAEHENNLAYQAGVKVGRTVTERALLYVMPYWRWMSMQVDVSGPGGGASFSQDYDGPGAQIGLDVLATQNVVVSTYFRGTFYGEESWGVPGLDVDTHELEGGLRVSFKPDSLFGN